MKTYQLIAALVMVEIRRKESEGTRGFEEARSRVAALLEGQSCGICGLLDIAEQLQAAERSKQRSTPNVLHES